MNVLLHPVLLCNIEVRLNKSFRNGKWWGIKAIVDAAGALALFMPYQQNSSMCLIYSKYNDFWPLQSIKHKPVQLSECYLCNFVY